MLHDAPQTTREARISGALLAVLLPACMAVLSAATPASGQTGAGGCRTPPLLGAPFGPAPRPGAPGAARFRVEPGGRLCAWTPLGSRSGAEGWGEDAGPAGTGPGPARSFAASLVVPGGGQWLQGRSRAYLYLGLEVVAWGAFIHGRLDGARFRDRYRDLAWTVARGGEGSRANVDDFRYYEALADYRESGAWDRDPERAGIQPETDPETYNGNVWALARQIHSVSGDDGGTNAEARSRALDYYRRHGYPPELAWSWIGWPDAERRYRNLIEESDNAFRRATIVLGVIAANHVLSAVDGFLSARLAADRPSAAALGAPAGWGGTRWSLEIRTGGDR